MTLEVLQPTQMAFLEVGISLYLKDHTKLHLFLSLYYTLTREHNEHQFSSGLSLLQEIKEKKNKKKTTSDTKAPPTTDSQLASLLTHYFLCPQLPVLAPPAFRARPCSSGWGLSPPPPQSPVQLQLLQLSCCAVTFSATRRGAASGFVLNGLPSRAMLFCTLDSDGATPQHAERRSSGSSAARSTRPLRRRDLFWLRSKPTRTTASALLLGKYGNSNRKEQQLTLY